MSKPCTPEEAKLRRKREIAGRTRAMRLAMKRSRDTEEITPELEVARHHAEAIRHLLALNDNNKSNYVARHAKTTSEAGPYFVHR